MIHYSGRVQGVGFRYTTRRIAQRFAVTGYVRNLADGRVQLVVEGAAADNAAFLAELRDYFTDHIHQVHEDRSPATGEFDGFAIR